MGTSVGNMHINFRFHVSCRWKQASDWNLPAVLIFQNGTRLEVIHRCSPPAAASCSPASHGKRSTEEQSNGWCRAGRWGGGKQDLQTWAVMDLNEEGRRTEEKHVFSGPGIFFWKQPHFLLLTSFPSKWPVSESSPLSINSNTKYLLRLSPTSKRHSLPTTSRHLLHPLPPSQKPRNEASSSPPQPQCPSQVPCSSHRALPAWTHSYPGHRSTENAEAGRLAPARLPVHTCRINPIQNHSLQVVLRRFLPFHKVKCYAPGMVAGEFLRTVQPSVCGRRRWRNAGQWHASQVW